MKKQSFTLFELLIVLAIISVLVTILILTIKPTLIFSKVRDTQRINHLKNIEKTIDLLYSSYPNFNELNYASTNIVYISLPDISPTCSSWINQLPSLPSGWSYRCSATPTNIDGTGWIPIPFKNFDIINIANLPIDPINKPPYYYTFVVGGSYEITAALENEANKGSNALGGKDEGDHNFVYEVGTNKKLTPSSVQSRAEPDNLKQGLVLWLTFDEGTGTTTKDLSGNSNNGILINGPIWTTGKVGGALSFDGVDDYVNLPYNFGQPSQVTIGLWFKTTQAYWDTLFGQTNNYPPNNCSAFISIFAIKGNGVLRAELWTGSIGEISTPFSVRDGNWHHAVIVGNVNTQSLYVDGQLINSRSGTIQQSWWLYSFIGTGYDYTNRSFPYNGWHYFNGLIDEVRIYNRALSADEIKALYEATK